MSAFLRRYPLISSLGVLAAVLAVVLALEIASSAGLRERYSTGAAQRTAGVQTRLLPAIAAVNPDQEYPETVARPLFVPTRRPAPALAVAGAPSAMVKGQFTLTGVIIANGLKTALLRESRSGRVVHVAQGKEVNGMTVAEIEPGKVTLTQAGDQEVVPLTVHKAAGAPPAPVAPLPASGPFAAPAQPVVPVMPPPAPEGAANPAARLPAPQAPGFGPPLRVPQPQTQQPQSAAPGDHSTAQAPLTPEELLAQRRARRAQQSQ